MDAGAASAALCVLVFTRSVTSSPRGDGKCQWTFYVSSSAPSLEKQILNFPLSMHFCFLEVIVVKKKEFIASPLFFFNALSNVLVSLGCCHIVPQTVCLSQKLTVSQYWRLDIWKQGEGRASSLRRLSGRICSLTSLSFWRCGRSLACR